MGSTARFEDKRNEILGVASRVFAEKGYHQASMRDIARGTGASLAGLYHYFPNKEEILYEISARAFDTVIAGAESGRNTESGRDFTESGAAEELRHFVRNHLSYFVEHLTEMKVLSHESESLTGDYRQRIQERKRRYVNLATEIVSRLPRGKQQDLRVSVLALFGMMNWIYTWYRSEGDGDIQLIATSMSDIFLSGFAGANGDGESSGRCTPRSEAERIGER